MIDWRGGSQRSRNAARPKKNQRGESSTAGRNTSTARTGSLLGEEESTSHRQIPPRTSSTHSSKNKSTRNSLLDPPSIRPHGGPGMPGEGWSCSPRRFRPPRRLSCFDQRRKQTVARVARKTADLVKITGSNPLPTFGSGGKLVRYQVVLWEAPCAVVNRKGEADCAISRSSHPRMTLRRGSHGECGLEFLPDISGVSLQFS
jgi:hypothetical protein